MNDLTISKIAQNGFSFIKVNFKNVLLLLFIFYLPLVLVKVNLIYFNVNFTIVELIISILEWFPLLIFTNYCLAYNTSENMQKIEKNIYISSFITYLFYQFFINGVKIIIQTNKSSSILIIVVFLFSVLIHYLFFLVIQESVQNTNILLIIKESIRKLFIKVDTTIVLFLFLSIVLFIIKLIGSLMSLCLSFILLNRYVPFYIYKIISGSFDGFIEGFAILFIVYCKVYYYSYVTVKRNI